MKRIFVVCSLIIVLVNASVFAQKLITHSFEEIHQLQLKEKRNIVVLIGTDWCRYCQMMKQVTLKNEAVINLLNSKFYFCYLNAEQREPIRFKQQTYFFKPTGSNTGLHDLALLFVNNQKEISFPTICLLNPSGETIFIYPGYLKQEDLLLVLSRFGYPVAVQWE